MKPKPESEWTWVHYKVLEGAFDNSRLPDLLMPWTYIGFPGGDTRVAETSREETQDALLDLLAVRALDLFEGEERLSSEAAVSVASADSSWSFDHGDDVEVVDNESTPDFLDRRPDLRHPRRPG